jgi:hypothetical protein
MPIRHRLQTAKEIAMIHRGTRIVRPFVPALALLLALTAGVRAQDQPTPEPKPAAAAPQPDEVKVLTLEDMLRERIASLEAENRALREALARSELIGSQVTRELDELRRFMADHDRLGDDFEQYQAVLDIKEREMRQARAEAYRERQAEEQAERRQRMEQARAVRDAQQEDRHRLRRYESEGFYHVGQNVFASEMAYQYTKENVPDRTYRFFPRIRFDGTFFFTRSWYIDYDEEIDWSEMTISGSVLSGAEEPTNIGISITFYDRYGRQVGGDTIEVEGARKDAPYPFTRTLKMAADRPFYSYRINVLHADPMDPADEDADEETMSQNPSMSEVIGLVFETEAD